MTTKYTKSTESTTIRVSKEIKEKMENLNFVRKHTFDEILSELIDNYEKNKRGKK